MDIIDCDLDACLNNGTCIELINGFACQCLPDFNGPRCQYRQRKNENSCKKKCLNQGKCIVMNNREKCLCSSKYSGLNCEFIRNNTLPATRKCSVLKFHNQKHTGTCLAIGLTPLSDVHCECHYNIKKENTVDCQITPTAYSGKIYLKLNSKNLF